MGQGLPDPHHPLCHSWTKSTFKIREQRHRCGAVRRAIFTMMLGVSTEKNLPAWEAEDDQLSRFPQCWGSSADTRFSVLKKGKSLATQWLRLQTSTTGGAGSIPGQGTKILHATQCGWYINTLFRKRGSQAGLLVTPGATWLCQCRSLKVTCEIWMRSSLQPAYPAFPMRPSSWGAHSDSRERVSGASLAGTATPRFLNYTRTKQAACLDPFFISLLLDLRPLSLHLKTVFDKMVFQSLLHETVIFFSLLERAQMLETVSLLGFAT